MRNLLAEVMPSIPSAHNFRRGPSADYLRESPSLSGGFAGSRYRADA